MFSSREQTPFVVKSTFILISNIDNSQESRASASTEWKIHLQRVAKPVVKNAKHATPVIISQVSANSVCAKKTSAAAPMAKPTQKTA